MSAESPGFGNREAGKQIRTKLLNLLAADTLKAMLVDWAGIPLISSSFADEAIGKLFIELGPLEFGVRVRNISVTVRRSRLTGRDPTMAEWVGEKPISCPCGWETFVSQRNRNDLSGASPQRSVSAGLRAQASTLLCNSAPVEKRSPQTGPLCGCCPHIGPGVYSYPNRTRIAELGLRAELAGGTFAEDTAWL